MLLRRILPILFFIIAIPIYGYGQEKVVKSVEKTDTARVVQDNQQKNKQDLIKAVPNANKTTDAIRLQNKKATMEQMHTINKAIRKSLTIHKRR
jgi:hypothetical protein